MTDAQIRWHAREFAKGILNGRSTQFMCYAVTAPLAGYLRAIGVECEAVEGTFAGEEHHWWVECRGRVIDLTADQFPGHKNYCLRRSTLHRPNPPPRFLAQFAQRKRT